MSSLSSVSKAGVCLAASLVLVAAPSFAQDTSNPIKLPSLAVIAFSEAPPIAPTTVFAAPSKLSTTLLSLDMTFAALQALDVHSTLSAKATGNGKELNPVVAGLLHKPAALVAFKGATTAGMIYVSHALAKRNRPAAILTMVGMNAAYGFVAWHNYSIARASGR